MYIVYLQDASGSFYEMPEMCFNFEDHENPKANYYFSVKEFGSRKEAKSFMNRYWSTIKSSENVESYEIVEKSNNICDFSIFISGSNKYGN